MSSSQLSLREQAALLAETAWDQVRDQSASLGLIASMLLDGRGEAASADAVGAAPSVSTAQAYLTVMAGRHPDTREMVSAIASSADAKARQADRFVGCVDGLARSSEGRTIASAEDLRIVERTSAQLKRQRATFEAVERLIAAQDAAPANIGELTAAIAALQARIDELDGLAARMNARQTV